jgi:hypothetical protein
VAIPRADLRLVDSLAADLIYFIGLMPVPRFRVTQARVIVSAMVAAAALVAISPMARAGFHTGCPASGPCSTPTPTAANIVLDIAAGGPSTRITATGTYFLANESMSLFWDTQAHVATSVTSDANGNFSVVVTPFPGDGTGAHRLCASVPPTPCAIFTLQGPPTPTPPALPSPSAVPTPSASASPSPSPSASQVALTVNGSGSGGLDVIIKPPFVFLPIVALLALLAALAYWVLMRGERTPVLPSASVVHRSSRPDVGPVTPRPPPTSPAPPVSEMPPPPADLPPPPAPFDPTEPDAPAGSSETPEAPPY